MPHCSFFFLLSGVLLMLSEEPLLYITLMSIYIRQLIFNKFKKFVATSLPFNHKHTNVWSSLNVCSRIVSTVRFMAYHMTFLTKLIYVSLQSNLFFNFVYYVFCLIFWQINYTGGKRLNCTKAYKMNNYT